MEERKEARKAERVWKMHLNDHYSTIEGKESQERARGYHGVPTTGFEGCQRV